ncbi:hypothetical protein ACPFL9_09845 [Paenarthrobacter sp. NyZ202]|uniref:hypothetical protein n=1 Tax=Paenarthrobacter sp. NyZ202 TaxID=3402689 RepID=UPI003CFAAB9D
MTKSKTKSSAGIPQSPRRPHKFSREVIDVPVPRIRSPASLKPWQAASPRNTRNLLAPPATAVVPFPWLALGPTLYPNAVVEARLGIPPGPGTTFTCEIWVATSRVMPLCIRNLCDPAPGVLMVPTA